MTSLLAPTTQVHQRNNNKKTGAEIEDATAVPDSTTTVERKPPSEFTAGQDILWKHKDGRYYFGMVVEVDSIREQCLVKFGDNTDNWSCFKDLVKLSTSEQEHLCVVCKKSAPKSKQEITVCYKCGRGYHQKCHQPEIPANCHKEDSNWMCKRCLDAEPHRQRRSTDSRLMKKDSVRKSDTTASSAITKLPYESPTSVSAPPTPPTSDSSNTGLESTDYSEQSSNIVLKKETLQELNTPCDTSDDETSSKSTLDLIIPPPKDFEGKNNPFIAFLRSNTDEHTKKRRSKDSITLPLPLTAVITGRPIVRPLKRQLSEKDICIGPNGEVKRRRLRRSRSGQQVPANYGQTASKTAAVVPVRPDANDWNQRSLRSNLNATGASSSTNTQISSCVDYALNGRRLRTRQDKSVEKDKKPPTPKPSPVKQEQDISMDDLKSSVHSYFGAATRIQDGERFTVKAKRYGPTGKLEYLMEWEGVSNGMT
ncbi:PREDICTED: metal-response element-binding transcription factor 2 [Nicrophorus vespilloides]|uniref:Metal-response element-binding transcription factor 2 n=1 Tax=Nicrophorus vespilloides TaxID=110193 RepID=A0ABM1N6H1_NICVS|nr:PREDICTED: metal-response element-binding transcription factor 2 [Nicrophorus vespilloides]